MIDPSCDFGDIDPDELRKRSVKWQMAGDAIAMNVADSDYSPGAKFFDEWQRRFPDAEAHRFSDAGHYVLEDVPEKIVPLVQDFLQRHPL